MNLLVGALWFFLPAGLANGAPVIAAHVPGLRRWRTPMDFGKRYRAKQIFGPNKTWRGLMVGIVTATLVVALQRYVYSRSAWAFDHSWINYTQSKIWLLGPLFGLGALGADALESFFKRQWNINPGHSWFPFDQIDYIIGGCLLSLIIVRLSFFYYIVTLLTWFVMHILVSYLAYTVGLKNKPI